ncbi:hypothetical protein HKBW3S33_01777 [Candidatus Hakubella thermalkaliphila]|uniref:Uncharacterized protein n=1 Tax=Candidatus Hakubella thermalkaliphila TaxID=2754717 RepID=A0A6V8P6U9_9ACTN|nr:hypothetical protein HKBW3S33_01777 [Candidatus Hakubella thermalkaliphila]
MESGDPAGNFQSGSLYRVLASFSLEVILEKNKVE